MIKAHFLFGAAYNDIDIVIHPQSIIHSMVETQDSSVLAQVCIQGKLFSTYAPGRPAVRLDQQKDLGARMRMASL